MEPSRPMPLIPQPLLNTIPPELVSRFDPKYVEYYNAYNVGRIAGHQVPIEHYRKDPARYATQYSRQYGGDVYRVSEQKCPVDGGEITIRIFEAAPVSTGQQQPAYINFHGGGWVYGNLETDDDFCRRIAREVGCVVFDVDYRLAPEFKFPIPIEDSWAAFNWIRNEKATEFNIDLQRIAVGGVSAGGHISAILALKARDEGIPLAFQLLCVPVTDLTTVFTTSGELDHNCPYFSYKEMRNVTGLPMERMQFFHNHFMGLPRPASYHTDFHVSPIMATNFSNLAPALVITAEMDTLRDEGEAYFKKLVEGGCKAERIMMKGVPHAFMAMDNVLEAGKTYNRETVKALRVAFQLPLA